MARAQVAANTAMLIRQRWPQGLPPNLARGRYLVLGSENRLRILESGCFNSSG